MNIVVAADARWGIGLGGTQTLVVPEDRRHFRKVTGTGTILVGRKTLLDVPGGKPLKNRRNIILTTDQTFTVEGGEIAHSVAEALELINEEDPDKVFVCGGESVYRQLLPFCKRAYVTRIDTAPKADAHFPNLDELPNWELEGPGEEREHEGLKYRFQTYVNRSI